MLYILRREEISVSTSDASTRDSLSRTSPKTFPPLRTPRAPRVPPSPTSNPKTSGAGAGDQLCLQQYEVSRSTPVQDARIPSEGNLRSTKVLRKVGGAAKVPPASPEEGLVTLPSAVDIVCICPRRLLQSAETTTICHNMHLTQDPHVETTHKTRHHQKPSSGAVRRRYGTARWFAARRTPLSRLTRRTRSRLESSTKPVRDSLTCDNTPSAHSFMCIDKVWCHFQHDNASSAPVGGAWRRH